MADHVPPASAARPVQALPARQLAVPWIAVAALAAAAWAVTVVLARGMGTTVEYYYRPGVERGMTRNTLDAEQCDVMLDMPVDSDDVLTTKALYRSTFVLVYRSDRGMHLKSLDDPQLKSLKN